MVSSRSFSCCHYHPVHSPARRLPMYIPRAAAIRRQPRIQYLSGTEADQHTGQQRRPAHLVQTANKFKMQHSLCTTSLFHLPPGWDGFLYTRYFRRPSHQQTRPDSACCSHHWSWGIKSARAPPARNEHRQKASGRLCARKPGQTLTIAQPARSIRCSSIGRVNCPATS